VDLLRNIDFGTVAIQFVVLLFSLSLHEAAHGWMADRFGDYTARSLGRVTLNPIPHIDPVGTVLFPLLQFFTRLPLIGWAKPVPVNSALLRNPRKDQIYVSLAGPASNLFMALCWAVVAKLAWMFPSSYFAEPMLEMARIGININVVLMVLNLLPLPPLDGGRIAVSLLPHRPAYKLSLIEPYGMFILIFLAVTPVLGWLLSAPVVGVMKLISFIFGL